MVGRLVIQSKFVEVRLEAHENGINSHVNGLGGGGSVYLFLNLIGCMNAFKKTLGFSLSFFRT